MPASLPGPLAARLRDTAGVDLASGGITPAVVAWAERTTPGARVAGCTVRPLAGGNVARWVEQVTLQLTGGHGPLELVQYLPWTAAHLPTRDVEAALDRIEQALGQMPALPATRRR